MKRLEAARKQDQHRQRQNHHSHHQQDHHHSHHQDHHAQVHQQHVQHQQDQHAQHHQQDHHSTTYGNRQDHHQSNTNHDQHHQQRQDDHLSSFIDLDFEHFVPGQVEDIEPPKPVQSTSTRTRTRAKNLHPHLNNHPSNFSVLVSGLHKNPNPKGKNHALKKYDQFTVNTSCFWGSTAVVQFQEIFITK